MTLAGRAAAAGITATDGHTSVGPGDMYDVAQSAAVAALRNISAAERAQVSSRASTLLHSSA
jgi:hypothetical protein